ncbi:hypothetical protein GALL_309560 [mine drainage metagenome]|uniref:Uncharacterized protein n=1 Tax=mine drainage metagenome TaxID=410659 RepID=A0A1J5QUL1_9ZZZZ
MDLCILQCRQAFEIAAYPTDDRQVLLGENGNGLQIKILRHQLNRGLLEFASLHEQGLDVLEQIGRLGAHGHGAEFPHEAIRARVIGLEHRLARCGPIAFEHGVVHRAGAVSKVELNLIQQLFAADVLVDDFAQMAVDPRHLDDAVAGENQQQGHQCAEPKPESNAHAQVLKHDQASMWK